MEEIDAAGSLVTATLEVAVPLAAIGTLAMALLQAAKSALGLHGIYHKWELYRSISDPRARSQLLKLASGTSEPGWAFFNQEIDHLFIQLQSAVATIIDYPRLSEHVAAFRFLTAGAGKDTSTWRKAAEGINELPAANDPEREAKLFGLRQAVEAKKRISKLAQHRIETLRLQIHQRWAWYNQIVAVVLGTILVMIVSDSLLIQWSRNFGLPETNEFSWALKISVSILGGLFAPFCKRHCSYT